MSNRKMMPLKRIHARDRRHSACHEAGHVVIAHHLGYKKAVCWILPTGETEDCLHYNTWSGRSQIGLTRLIRPKHRVMIAVAGAIAEEVLCTFDPVLAEICEYHIMLDELENNIGETMSDADWEMSQCERDPIPHKMVKHALTVWGLLNSVLKPALIATTRQLIIDAREIAVAPYW